MRGLYEIDEEQSRVVTQIFEWLVSEKLSIRRIVERLNQRGYKPYMAARWAKSTVSRILRNETYIGRAFYNRRERVEPQDGGPAARKNKKSRHRWRPDSEWIPQSVPHIITPELFDAAQATLKQNSAHCSGRPAKTFYLLRGLLRCSSCGRRFTGETIFGDKYYRCIGRERLATPRCSAPAVAAKLIEPFVWNYLLHFLSNPKLLSAKLAEQETREQDLEAELSRIENQIREIQVREGRLLNALLDGDVPLPGLREKAKELERGRLQLREAQQAIEARIAMKRDETQLHQTVLRYCKILGNAVSTLDPEAKHKLLRALLDEVTLDGTRVSLKGILPTSLQVGNRPQHQHVVAAGGGDF
ncbi:MAG: recombinase family protein [Bryobacteraceae bacterium]